jgi:hypothetical protein
LVAAAQQFYGVRLCGAVAYTAGNARDRGNAGSARGVDANAAVSF